ncbi:DUF4385 family protein [Haloprofundus halobius]|uniref:DUF4385 family protein n=1 Tax=Haloprofundus halobius TaxID=2876194 RepID=UPI001CCB3E95|nr:DUF4385 family protein [Haloprofundus halobius]
MDSTSGGSRTDDESEADGARSTESTDEPAESNGEAKSTDYGLKYETNVRDHPERYRVGRGEEGVFKVQPYKDELLPLWSDADRASADESSEAIYSRVLDYRDDFVGMDMSRKYLQMGSTRAMRYARYSGGKKYDHGKECNAQYWADDDKREAALIYEVWWNTVEADETYTEQKRAHREKHG